jgi:uroporphyrinogen decarboxylase
VDYKVDLGLAGQALAGRIALAGNVNPLMLKDSPLEALVAETHRCIRAGYGYNRFILMPGYDIPPTTLLTNFRAFVMTACLGYLHSHWHSRMSET